MMGMQKAARGGYSASTKAWPFSFRSLLSWGLKPKQGAPGPTNDLNRSS